jgi:hypothetical protein
LVEEAKQADLHFEWGRGFNHLNGCFLMGEFSKEKVLLTVFWTVSHPDYDHSLVLISKMSPFSARHLLLGCITNAELDQEDGLFDLVLGTFARLSGAFGRF